MVLVFWLCGSMVNDNQVSAFDRTTTETSILWRSLSLPSFAEPLSVAIPPHIAYAIRVIDGSHSRNVHVLLPSRRERRTLSR